MDTLNSVTTVTYKNNDKQKVILKLSIIFGDEPYSFKKNEYCWHDCSIVLNTKKRTIAIPHDLSTLHYYGIVGVGTCYGYEILE